MRESYLSAGGVRTRCLSTGSGPPAVLLHGFHGFAEHWRWCAPLLAPHLTCHALDMLGHGKTARPRRGYLLDDYVDHLLASMDALEIHQASVVGNSLGGAVALRAAVRAPERVDRLVLLCPAGMHGTTRAGAAQFLLGVGEVALGIRTETLGRWSARLQFSDPSGTDPAFFAAKERDARLRRHGSYRRATLRQSWEIARMRSIEPEAVRQPTLVLWGTEDRSLSWERALDAVGRLPAGRLVLVPDAGHLPHVEQPERVAQETIAHLAPGAAPDARRANG